MKNIFITGAGGFVGKHIVEYFKSNYQFTILNKNESIEKGYLKGKTGGIREGAGRSKSGWYKGYYCNSSYELAWVIYSLDNNKL